MENHGLLRPGTAWKSQGGQEVSSRQAAPGSRRGQWGRYGATRNKAVGRVMFGAEKMHL